MQFFLGYREYSNEKPFDPPLIVRFRQRFSLEQLNAINTKLAISFVGGFASLEKLSWDNFNEGMTLIQAIERYKLRHGFYPASVHENKIFRTRDNILYCLEHGSRISGLKLGRPPKEPDPVAKKQARLDELDLKVSEGKFGERKRRYGLNLIKAKLQETTETVIIMNLIVMNLAYLYRSLVVFFSKSIFRVCKAKFYCRQAGFCLPLGTS